MDNGAVGAIAGNGLKAKAQTAGGVLPELIQVSGGGGFSKASFPHVFFQPLHKPHHD